MFFSFQKDEDLSNKTKDYIEIEKLIIKIKENYSKQFEWKSKLLYWSENEKKGYKYSKKKNAWWIIE